MWILDDSKIINLFFERNEQAISELEGKYGTYCYSVSWNILRVKEDAEECVNESFYKAWTSIPPLVPANLKIWLARVVRNVSINQWKKNHAKKRYAGIEIQLSELEECVPSPMRIDNNVEELGKIISTWLRTVSKEERRIFLLRYFWGKKVREIAKIEQEKAEKISKKLFVLRNQLKNVLEEEGMIDDYRA